MNFAFIRKEKFFVCINCNRPISPLKYGGHHRNHCPFCLWSKHVDGEKSGDRKSKCLGMMAPVGVSVRRTGEHVLTHKCLKCGFERWNRIAGDDDFGLIDVLDLAGAFKTESKKSRLGAGERLEKGNQRF